MSRVKLAVSGLVKYLLGAVLVGALLLLPAWTLRYPGAWLFLGVLFIPMLLMGVVMLIKAPQLLEKRLSHKEKQKTQKGVVGLSGLMFLGGFVLCALDFRFGWSHVPTWLMIMAAIVFLAGYAMYAEVMRENAYLSRTVEVQKGQRVIDTGLYGLVRHPMYLATLLMFVPLPLILQSLWGLCIFCIYPVLIVIRILNEEKVLTAELAGYADYSRREPNSHGFARQISAPAAEKMLAISYIASHYLFASAKYLLAQNCTAPSGVEFFDGYCQSESKQVRILRGEIWHKMRKILAAGRMSSALFGYKKRSDTDSSRLSGKEQGDTHRGYLPVSMYTTSKNTNYTIMTKQNHYNCRGRRPRRPVQVQRTYYMEQ